MMKNGNNMKKNNFNSPSLLTWVGAKKARDIDTTLYLVMLSCVVAAISAIITAKECRLCFYYEAQSKEPPSHDCPRNYSGSSKDMESEATLSLYESMFYDSKNKIYLRSIVSDNDSTMRALLKHPGNHKRGKSNPENTRVKLIG